MENKESSRRFCWGIDDNDERSIHYGNEHERYFADLVRVARADAPLSDAFLTLAHYQDVQSYRAKELLEREVWAVTAILAESRAIWDRLASRTLRFLPTCGGPEQSHFELGHFNHLAALSSPSEGERTLVATSSPCWARVSRSPERERCGYSGSLGYRYEPVSVEEAVATLGLERILAEIKAATRDAGAAALAEVQSQEERAAQLLAVERMLGWQSDPDLERPQSMSMRLLLMLTAKNRGTWLAVAAILVILLIGLCFVY